MKRQPDLPSSYPLPGVPGNLPPSPKKRFPPPAIFPRKFALPPRKHSLLHRFKLGIREAFYKMKILKVFVSIYR